MGSISTSFNSSIEEIKYLIFSFTETGNKAKRGVGFRNGSRIGRRVGNERKTYFNLTFVEHVFLYS